MPSLLDLPPEIVEQIISVLAEKEPPSAKFIYEQPSESLLNPGCHPLKDLSCVCQVLRRFCFSSVFSALKVDIGVVTGFVEFIESSQLAGRVDSLVLFSTPGCLGSKFIWPRMVEVVDRVDAPSVTIMLPPSVFADILPYDLNLEHAWAFDIDYQIVHLKMPRGTVAPKTPENAVKDRNVFALRPWTHCTYNEGSSIKVYSTYEYYFKDKPSPFCAWNFQHFSRAMENSLHHITSLDIIAVFPTNLWWFGKGITSMPNLRSLRMQLAPTPANNVLDDPSSLGKCQPKDLWMEFENLYDSLIGSLVNGDTRLRSIEHFTILDYANAALRETIDDVVGNLLDEWERDPGGGSWTRIREDPEAIFQ